MHLLHTLILCQIFSMVLLFICVFVFHVCVIETIESDAGIVWVMKLTLLLISI
jgi:hypothetical protein